MLFEMDLLLCILYKMLITALHAKKTLRASLNWDELKKNAFLWWILRLRSASRRFQTELTTACVRINVPSLIAPFMQLSRFSKVGDILPLARFILVEWNGTWSGVPSIPHNRNGVSGSDCTVMLSRADSQKLDRQLYSLSILMKNSCRGNNIPSSKWGGMREAIHLEPLYSFLRNGMLATIWVTYSHFTRLLLLFRSNGTNRAHP